MNLVEIDRNIEFWKVAIFSNSLDTLSLVEIDSYIGFIAFQFYLGVGL